jgi:signal transduction histidine kinase
MRGMTTDDGLLGAIDHQARSHPWTLDALFALALAGVLGPLSVSSLHGARQRAGWLAVSAVAFGVLQVSVAFRRRDPALAYLAASLAMFVLVAVPDFRVADPSAGHALAVPMVYLPSSLVFLLMLYSFASQTRSRRWRLSGLLIAMAGAALVAIRTGVTFHQVYPAGAVILSCAAAAVLCMTAFGAWGLGSLRLLQQQRAEARLAEAARIAVLEERGRISRDMHDIVAHTLAVIVRQAEGGAFAAQRSPDQAVQALRVIAGASREALADMRGMLGVLRDDDNGDTGNGGDGPAGSRPQPGLADVQTLLDRVRATGLTVEYAADGTAFHVGPAIELAVYRLVQEALTNTVKHAGPDARVMVRLDWAGAILTVAVTSASGDRAHPSAPVPGTGAGLRGLAERVSAAGGTFSSGRDGDGFAVRATFQRRDKEDAR